MTEPRVRQSRRTAVALPRLAAGRLLRLLENVLAVGEDPDNLVVYAALGKAARNWPAHDAIVATLEDAGRDETLIVQSGKPIGVLTTHARAPLVHHGQLQHRRAVGQRPRCSMSSRRRA